MPGPDDPIWAQQSNRWTLGPDGGAEGDSSNAGPEPDHAPAGNPWGLPNPKPAAAATKEVDPASFDFDGGGGGFDSDGSNAGPEPTESNRWTPDTTTAEVTPTTTAATTTTAGSDTTTAEVTLTTTAATTTTAGSDTTTAEVTPTTTAATTTTAGPLDTGTGGAEGDGSNAGPEPDHAPAGIVDSIVQPNPWGLTKPKPAAAATKEVDPAIKPAGTANVQVAPKPAPQQPTQSDGFDAEEYCNHAADRCMAFDDDAEACDDFKPCINLWMLAGRLKLLKVPTACGCGTPDADEEENDCDDEWICEKTDFTTCRCFEPEGTEDDAAGCAAQSDRTGDAVCGWNADTEQCTGCPMLEEGECQSSANPNCEWKVTVCGVVDAASHTAPPFDSAGNICV
jgi:hypothetical protein